MSTIKSSLMITYPKTSTISQKEVKEIVLFEAEIINNLPTVMNMTQMTAINIENKKRHQHGPSRCYNEMQETVTPK